MPEARIAVLGLGYVGLPLALALARSGASVVGFDIDSRHVADLKSGHDRTGELSPDALANTSVSFTSNPAELAQCSTYILAVPTPITEAHKPDLEPLLSACRAIAPGLSSGDLVIVESTVYPGVTEEVCGPLLADLSGLDLYADIRLGYSPERVNPGDAAHALESVVKVIAAQDEETLHRVAAIYEPVVKAGLYRAASIMTAEAAKVIENTQRDLNIALVNEFALIFSRLGLDTQEVLEAAGTKWNFLPFKPGLVGGHCIGVDPYYLTHRAEELGYHPEVILAGRRINDEMGRHVARELVKALVANGVNLSGARVLVMGFTFKENCADIRNSLVGDIVEELASFAVEVDVHDPWVALGALEKVHGIENVSNPQAGTYDATIVAVAHRQFAEMGASGIRALGKPEAILYDVKGMFEKDDADLRL